MSFYDEIYIEKILTRKRSIRDKMSEKIKIENKNI